MNSLFALKKKKSAPKALKKKNNNKIKVLYIFSSHYCIYREYRVLTEPAKKIGVLFDKLGNFDSPVQ